MHKNTANKSIVQLGGPTMVGGRGSYILLLSFSVNHLMINLGAGAAKVSEIGT